MKCIVHIVCILVFSKSAYEANLLWGVSLKMGSVAQSSLFKSSALFDVLNEYNTHTNVRRK